ncbi:unnamed protein product [Linum tenue]|uniref:Uncharacterized protein n=1 Tax=Linum tenue TaxID=586396 RepID=A0AAV0IEV3_9ROSI|nr:unnamed protein product [Linum tenue]
MLAAAVKDVDRRMSRTTTLPVGLCYALCSRCNLMMKLVEMFLYVCFYFMLKSILFITNCSSECAEQSCQIFNL